MVSISACHAEDPGSIPGRGVCVAVGNKTVLLAAPPLPEILDDMSGHADVGDFVRRDESGDCDDGGGW